jgi:CubicO group peptidase (beta-lactamase class C family)
VRLSIRVAVPLIALVITNCGASPVDDLDSFVTAQMARRHIAGLSLAIIQNGNIVVARAYGVMDRGSNNLVTPRTLFQAGSISKAVAAFGALHLVEEHKLDLDAEVNAVLKSWRLPSNQFTTKPVTLRGLLSHSAGLSVYGFMGYAVGETTPTLAQVLEGTHPANSAPIRVEAVPGSRWSYSGGGYTIVQQMMIDVTGQRFPDLMRQTVLAPLSMTHSSYEQPLPPAMAAAAAAGHHRDGSTVEGRWHVYPEMAAAGLWTTPTDLARFVIEVQQAYAGNSTRIISQAIARQMLTDQKNSDGLGVFLTGSGKTLFFGHDGRDVGFDADLSASAETGQGAVIMINANDESHMISRIRGFIAKKYHWPNASWYVLPRPVPAHTSEIDAVAGRYELPDHHMIAFVSRGGHLFSLAGATPDEEFLPIAGGSFASTERNVRFSPQRDSAGTLTGIVWTPSFTFTTWADVPGSQLWRIPADSRPEAERSILPRIGPLFPPIARRNGKDSVQTRRVEAAIATRASGRAPQRLVFVASYDVVGRNIERHGSKVARVAYYKMTAGAGERILLVYLTDDGLVADVDDVDK